MDQNTAMCQFLDEVKVGEGTAGDVSPMALCTPNTMHNAECPRAVLRMRGAYTSRSGSFAA